MKRTARIQSREPQPDKGTGTPSTSKGHPKFFLIDGNSFCYRAYYAIRHLSNSRGEPTNAIYGFVTMMRKMLEQNGPEYLAVCFDRKEPTFRHEKYKEYKATRKPMPEDLVFQMEPIKAFCQASRMAVFEKPGFEADDLIGTLAKLGEIKGMDVFILTGDKDAMQLVDDRIRIMNPHKENEIFDRKKVKKRFEGLGPEKVVDVMALAGDSSDNIPGVPGIGEKTALKLIQQFGSIEALFENVAAVKSKSQQSLLRDHEEKARLSKELARINTGIALEIDWDSLKVREPDGDRLLDFFKRYEFRNLIREYTPSGQNAREEARRYRAVETEKQLQAFAAEMKGVKAFSFDTETTHEDPMRARLVGMSFSWTPFEAVYVPVSSPQHRGPGLAQDTVLEALRGVLENEKQAKYGQHIKYDWIVMKRHGVALRGIAFDTMIASYLLNPLKLNHNLDDIALEHLSLKKIPTVALIGSGKKQRTMDEVPLPEITSYACEDADCVMRLEAVFRPRLEEQGLTELFEKMEMPLAEVLAKMEMNGVNLDLKFLKKLSDNAAEDLEELTREIYREAGEEFNINSTKQLSEVLFVKLKLPVIKRTKTGYSTDVNVLEKLAADHELPKRILEFRERSKLKSTYMDALPQMIHPETGLIHTSYHQTTTATGRLSSSDPNLQNIPVKTEMGRMIRKAFVPRTTPGQPRKIVSADYSQIELRILAHLSGDENLSRAFQEDLDVHKYTATLLYGVPEKDVTREMRNLAKTINLSIIYGKTAYGLSLDLGIPVAEADGFIENYFTRYRAVRDYLESQKDLARRQGFLTTLFGRRSYFPEINSKNGQIRAFAERAAINAPIQGSAADLIKRAMITLQKRLEAEKLRSLMVMQVHDELVFDALEEELDRLVPVVKEEMENAHVLKVPLRVDIFTGDSWYKN